MSHADALSFVDFASSEPEASADFYAAVFGWEVEPRPAHVFHRSVPGQNFELDEGSRGPTGDLHMGISNAVNARPPTDPAGADPHEVAETGHSARVWVLVSEDHSVERILDEAASRGATQLWRDLAPARSLLGGVHRVQRGTGRSVKHHVHALGQRRRRPPDSGRLDP